MLSVCFLWRFMSLAGKILIPSSLQKSYVQCVWNPVNTDLTVTDCLYSYDCLIMCQPWWRCLTNAVHLIFFLICRGPLLNVERLFNIVTKHFRNVSGFVCTIAGTHLFSLLFLDASSQPCKS
jgi:hypothetical protein